MNNNWTVYDHEFPDGKHYIGITSQPVEQRWGKEGGQYRNQPVWLPIQKYGWNNIQHHILYTNVDLYTAQLLEQQMIEKYDSYENGYNCTKGGDHSFEMDINGKIYTSQELAELSEHDISNHDITNRLNEHGWDLTKTLTTPLQNKKHKFLFNGELLSIHELYERRINKDLTYRQIATRIYRHHWDPERAITQSSKTKLQPSSRGEKKYHYNGQDYNSYELSQIHPELNLTSFDITDRINHHGWDVERAISQPKRKRS